MGLSKNEKSLLLHTLGLNYQSVHFRNHFCASLIHSDYGGLKNLCDKGLMKIVESPSFCNDSDIIFIVTEFGIKKAYEILKEEDERLTRS